MVFTRTKRGKINLTYKTHLKEQICETDSRVELRANIRIDFYKQQTDGAYISKSLLFGKMNIYEDYDSNGNVFLKHTEPADFQRLVKVPHVEKGYFRAYLIATNLLIGEGKF